MKKQTEIVIEIERIQLIRKRAKSWRMFCPSCAAQVNFIRLVEIAKLFNRPLADFYPLIQTGGKHYATDQAGEIFICLELLSAFVNGTNDRRQIKMIEGEKL